MNKRMQKSIHKARNLRRSFFFLAVMAVFFSHSQQVLSATPVFEIEIKDHLFYPAELTIPANKKVKLLIKNRDPTAEEFESYELNREKVIVGNSATVIFVGPLPKGTYPFFGEFFPKTAQGKILVD